ncbi:hypothetical protein VNO77_19648 [Canavalia gladiata]|uniref:TF-B3 domain-containing protein n=1 Tax=Canavalia gladiata TaxID=3824 RepID=A0AAN9LRB2_CANGL
MGSEFPHKPQMKPIHFFKIITTPILNEGKLMIPSRFVEKYGEGLPNTLFLKPPNGAEWKLNLEKREGKIWFQKGWKEFAEHHSVAHGHLLVFRCEGTSHFQVHIFDMSGLEIDYPFRKPCNDPPNNPPNDENLEYERPGQKTQKRKFNSCEMSSSKCAKVENTLILPQATLDRSDRKCQEKSRVIGKQVTALDRASSFQSCNPFFLVVMYPSHLHSRYGSLCLPSMFCKTHFGLHKTKRDMNLQVLHGRVWSVRYLISKMNTGTRFRLRSGWNKFTKDNNLKVGDVCTFELILRNNVTFQVHIFRGTHNSNCSTSQESVQMRAASEEQIKEMKIISSTASLPPKIFKSSF